METFGDWVAITNSATANAESAASSIAVNPGAKIRKITVFCATVGNTYAVKIDFPGVKSPQKWIIPCAGVTPNTNGSKITIPGRSITCNIPVPQNQSTVSVSTFADVASATCKVGIVWEC